MQNRKAIQKQEHTLNKNYGLNSFKNNEICQLQKRAPNFWKSQNLDFQII